jgi:hypothetical protein
MQQTFDHFSAWSTSLNGGTEEAAVQQAALLVDMLQAYAGGPRGYRLRRIMLTNFWLYGLQEFEIPHGRLFLAGENASGKSTVLMAALPLALDGDLRPNRLDTFGGRERHIEYYVLGGTESATPFSHERRTAYIALEFEWCDPHNPPIADELRQRWENGEREKTRFLTIGISLAGNINVSDRIRPLRFLITDGSRLGYDLHTVYETGSKHDKRAYDHARFKQQLEGHGIICESQAEYERQVARYLFGFADLKDFQKLINLLLILRRPNLSSELSFSKVHDYLKQSLRKISGETTSRVIGTIERIDAIQGEIERIQEAYNGVDRLHLAQQNLVLGRARVSAYEYLGTQLAEDSMQSRVTRLRKELSSTENERQRAQVGSQALQAEQYQANAQIKTLETSEGLHVARQLTTARERTKEVQVQERLQGESLEATRQAERAGIEHLEHQRSRFEKMKADSSAHLRGLCAIAREECFWEMAAVQLEESLRQIASFSTETLSAPAVPPGITALTGVQSEERIAWLHHLEGLHQQREKLETKLQYARNLETTRFQELDDVRRRFQLVQDHAHEVQQSLNTMLKQLFPSHESTSSLVETLLVEVLPSQTEITDDESFSGRVVEQFAAVIKGYRQAIETLENELNDAADQLQGELNELQLLAGSKGYEVSEARALYELKLSEPDFTPLRSARHILARAKLAEQGIAALPLYALLDFAPAVDRESAEAGRIEYMLEDAGLLDALVVTPSQAAAADALLLEEGLSDCRLNMEVLSYQFTSTPDGHRHTNMLCFDTAHKETLIGDSPVWEETAAAILATIGACIETARFSMHEGGSWTHGLLIGHAEGGAARYIGQATRLRARQRELDELNEKRARLEDELSWFHDQLAAYEKQLLYVQEKQVQLRKVLPNSGIEEVYAELAQTRLALDDVRSKYQKARLQTQEARQSCNTIIAQLERESKGIAPLASDLKSTQHALMGVVKLKNQAQSLQNQLASVIHTWEECHQATASREQAQKTMANAASLYERIYTQVLQARAEEDELQRIAEASDAQELSERLRSLREQSEALAAQLEEAKTSYARADERASNIQNNLAEAVTHLQQVTYERIEKQRRFVDLLGAYPVEVLVDTLQLTIKEQYSSAVQKLLGGSPRDENIPAYKEHLEEIYRDAYNGLLKTFAQEQSVLLEYGPDLDDLGFIRFLNENKSRPVELLEILSDHIEMQKNLLGQEERLLFEEFLLQEMAEAIRTAIFEAEEWVQQINQVLSGLPMIGEHYALQWKPPAEYNLAQLGSHLAQHYKLLRKPAQALTPEETETLMGAFRREIEAVRLRQQESADINFMDALEQIFDYREWFHFDVLVTPIGGQRQRLTDRMAGTRSGAEQLFALYVPLFAALGALYQSAAPGAPRLLALDEAFDKVSAANTQRVLEFLVLQGFQWVMTGPQISGTGAKIPACARYLMIHEKGSPVATATVSFWSQKPNLVERMGLLTYGTTLQES